MAGGSASPDLREQLDALSRIGAAGDCPDADLLRRFLAGPEATARAALAVLVERHGAMVLRTCRQALGDPHDAQDAFQATFLVLARKARSVRDADSVAGWLHGVALRVAARARADAARRKTFERRAAEVGGAGRHGAASPAGSWPELHEEVARLPGRYREPLVLCYLEGLSTEAAASRIGCPRGTVLSRLSRARDRLRSRLIRRGLAPPGGLLAGGPAGEAREAMPGPLLAATVGKSLAFAGRLAAEATPSLGGPTFLAMGVIHAMMISKLNVVGTSALALACLLGGVRAFATPRTQDLPVATAPAPGRAPAALPAPAPAPAIGVRYEYQSARLILEANLAAKANEESAKGWELYTIVPVVQGAAGNINTQFTMLFRRPVEAKP